MMRLQGLTPDELLSWYHLCVDSVVDRGFLVGTAELHGEGLARPFVSGSRGVLKAPRGQASKARASASLTSDVRVRDSS